MVCRDLAHKNTSLPAVRPAGNHNQFKISMARGLALCQGVLGTYLACAVIASVSLIMPPQVHSDRVRFFLGVTAIGAFGLAHMMLLITALPRQRARALPLSRAVSMMIIGLVLAVVLAVGADGAPWSSLIVTVALLLIMPMTLLMVTRGSSLSQ